MNTSSLGSAARSHQGFQSVVLAELVTVSAQEELRFRAGLQEIERIRSPLGFYRSAKRNDRPHVRIGTADARTHGAAKGKSREDDRQLELMFQPGERCANVILFPAAIVVSAFAVASSTKVEAQYWESERVQRFHGVKH